MRPIRRILVAVKDPRARSLPAVKKAAQLAHATGAALELFHSIADAIYIDALGMAQQSTGEFESRSRRRYLQRLESIAAPLRMSYALPRVSRYGDMHRTIAARSVP